MLEERLAQLNQAVDVRYIAESFFQPSNHPSISARQRVVIWSSAITTQHEKHCDISLPKLDATPQPIQLWLHKSLLGMSSLASIPSPEAWMKDFRRTFITLTCPTAFGNCIDRRKCSSTTPTARTIQRFHGR